MKTPSTINLLTFLALSSTLVLGLFSLLGSRRDHLQAVQESLTDLHFRQIELSRAALTHLSKQRYKQDDIASSCQQLYAAVEELESLSAAPFGVCGELADSLHQVAEATRSQVARVERLRSMAAVINNARNNLPRLLADAAENPSTTVAIAGALKQVASRLPLLGGPGHDSAVEEVTLARKIIRRGASGAEEEDAGRLLLIDAQVGKVLVYHNFMCEDLGHLFAHDLDALTGQAKDGTDSELLAVNQRDQRSLTQLSVAAIGLIAYACAGMLRFREQAKQLRKLNDSLETRVLQRTQELSKAVKSLECHIAAIDRVQGRVEFTPTGKILAVNDNLAAVMGYKPCELVGMHHRVLVPDAIADSDEYRAFWEKLSRGETLLGEYQRVAKDGAERWIYGTYSPVLDDRGRVQKIIKYAIDHTDRRALEEQLSRAQKLESIGQMAAGIAHEINTPMQFVGDNIEYMSDCSDTLFGVIDDYLQLLEDDEMPENWPERKQAISQLIERGRFDRIRNQVPAAIEESREGVQRTIKIVRAMKDFSHPGTKEMHLACLNDLIQSTIAISRNRWKYSAEMLLELEPDLPDAPMLVSEINQVLLNLIVNAGDAIAEKNSGQEGVQGSIIVRTYSRDDSVLVEIEDDGCGMSDDIQKKVFDPFFTTKDVGKGTGQGLSITHNVIVGMHKGWVHLQSKEGVGSVFTLELPRDLPQQAELGSSIVSDEVLV